MEALEWRRGRHDIWPALPLCVSLVPQCSCTRSKVQKGFLYTKHINNPRLFAFVHYTVHEKIFTTRVCAVYELVCLQVLVSVCVHMHDYVSACTRLRTCSQPYVCLYVSMCMCSCPHVPVRVRVLVLVRVCVCISIHLHVWLLYNALGDKYHGKQETVNRQWH